MKWASLNIDEIMFRIHSVVWDYFLGPIWYVVSLKWIWGSSAASTANSTGFGSTEGAGFFDKFIGSPLYRLFNSRPSAKKDSVEELFNPTAERSNWEFFTDLLLGRSDHESIFSILFGSIFGWFILLAIFGLLIWLIMKRRLYFLNKKERAMYDLAYSQDVKQEANNKATRWQKILDQTKSEEQSDWKIAVMDADILLDEVLAEQGFVGVGVGEKLKDAEKGDFTTLQYAWEGHKVRNSVAHDAAFVLTKRDARMAISMYERFFNEFYHAS